jgi:hypothetical protein
MIHADEMRKDEDIHWLVPEIATKVSHPPVAASASRELMLDASTTTPRINMMRPQSNT